MVFWLREAAAPQAAGPMRSATKATAVAEAEVTGAAALGAGGRKRSCEAAGWLGGSGRHKDARGNEIKELCTVVH